MNIHCAWCKVIIDDCNEVSDKTYPITHGICHLCRNELLNQGQEGLGLILEGFNQPLVVLDNDGLVVAANAKACSLLDKNQKDLLNKLPGDAVGCCHAFEAGGCGKSAFCDDCELRKVIVETIRTGKPQSAVQVCLDRSVAGGEVETQILIDSEMCGEVLVISIKNKG